MLIINQNTECVTTKSCGSSNALSLYLLRTAQDRSGPLSATLAFLECLMSSTNRRHSTRSATGIAADKVQTTYLVAQRRRMQHTEHKPETIQKQSRSNPETIHKQSTSNPQASNCMKLCFETTHRVSLQDCVGRPAHGARNVCHDVLLQQFLDLVWHEPTFENKTTAAINRSLGAKLSLCKTTKTTT